MRGGLYLYTEDYSTTTQHTSAGYDIILTPITGQEGDTVDVDLEVTDPDGSEADGTDGSPDEPPLRTASPPLTPKVWMKRRPSPRAPAR